MSCSASSLSYLKASISFHLDSLPAVLPASHLTSIWSILSGIRVTVFKHSSSSGSIYHQQMLSHFWAFPLLNLLHEMPSPYIRLFRLFPERPHTFHKGITCDPFPFGS